LLHLSLRQQADAISFPAITSTQHSTDFYSVVNYPGA